MTKGVAWMSYMEHFWSYLYLLSPSLCEGFKQCIHYSTEKLFEIPTFISRDYDDHKYGVFTLTLRDTLGLPLTLSPIVTPVTVDTLTKKRRGVGGGLVVRNLTLLHIHILMCSLPSTTKGIKLVRWETSFFSKVFRISASRGFFVHFTMGDGHYVIDLLLCKYDDESTFTSYRRHVSRWVLHRGFRLILLVTFLIGLNPGFVLSVY